MRGLLLPATLLLLAGCGDTEPDRRGVDRDETLLSVSASGEAEAVPDMAYIEIGVESFGGNAAAASKANEDKISKIATAIAAHGVADKDTQTRNLSLNRVEYGKRKGQFQAMNILQLRLRDATKAGAVVAAATGAGANVLSGPSLRIGDPEKANRGAYIAAYRAARTRAEAYAEAAGMEISRVLTIRDGGQFGGGPIPYGPMDAMAEQAAVAVSAPPPPVSPVSIRPGSTLTRVSVQVDFALEPK